ncbi:HopJ type III effector protein [Tenacibaculum finnmarkense]|uniref:HopJ type III effector protein n=1 Tax=Tenacibaculum finnmarkense TaxID=2781243 RepID=UPI001E62A72C|nr:HopJ type III effector protein [Tenacibaculum finnmarkense]MCD8421702.1 HopJ type III effector protein [Tenacibaculum finnmarkense genomovar ulcerans]MCG8237828.1 HopJ type III effector protein [Tenacibaculum finnmarkense genomovar ulcerans]
MTLQEFKNKLRNTPKELDFSDTINVIEENYNFTPSAFKNGDLENTSTQNLGSCKVLSFAVKQQLTKEEALACFAQYYFIDVLENPRATDHQNIRNFMKTGFEELSFENETLVEKV